MTGPFPRILMLSAMAIALLLAVGLLYLGSVLGITLVQANRDPLALTGFSLYLLVGLFAPVLLGMGLIGMRGSPLSRALLFSALASLLGQAFFLPVALAALRM